MSWFKSVVNFVTKPIEATAYALTGNIKEAGNSLGEMLDEGKKAFVDPITNPDVQKAALAITAGAIAGPVAAAGLAGQSAMSSIQQQQAVDASKKLIQQQEEAQTNLIQQQVQAVKDLTDYQTQAWTNSGAIVSNNEKNISGYGESMTLDNGKIVSLNPGIFTGPATNVNQGTNTDKLSINQIPADYSIFIWIGIVVIVFILIKKGGKL